MNSRYERQLIMDEIGENGQQKLHDKKVAIIGCGGLGSLNIYYFASIGVGHILLVDDDKVEMTNLNRQIIHTVNDIGRFKVDSAEESILKLNPDIHVIKEYRRLTSENADSILTNVDIIIDAVDNIETRYTLDDYCNKTDKPIIFAAVEGFKGFVYVKTSNKSPDYSTIFPIPPRHAKRKIGVFGAGVGVVSSVECVEGVKILLDMAISSKILNMDLMKNYFEEIDV